MASSSQKTNYRCVPFIQRFYTGGVFAVSSDGSFVVCACDDSLKVVDTSNGYVRSTLEGDTESVTSLSVSPDDKLLFSCSHSRQIIVWDLSSFKRLRSWKGHDGPVMAMCCDASGGLLATAGSDRKVLVWDVDGGFCTHYFKGHKGIVSSIMFHPDPARLLLFSGSDDATVRIWDLQSKKCLATLERHFSMVTSLAVSEDGCTLLSAGRDKVVNLWNLHDYCWRMTVPAYEVLEAICVVHAGTFLSFLDPRKNSSKAGLTSDPIFVTVGERGIVRVWNSKGAVCMFEQQFSDIAASVNGDESKRGFKGVFLLPSDKGLLCISADQQFLFYSPATFFEKRLNLSLYRRLIGYNEGIVDLKFLDDDEDHLVLASNLQQVQLYDVSSSSCSHVLSGHTDVVLCLDTCVTHSGRKLIVTGGQDNSVRLWDAERKQCIGVGMGNIAAVGAVAFSKKGRNFFVSGSRDRTLKVWSLDCLSDNTSEPVALKTRAIVAAHDKDINSVAIAPNDSLVCSGSQDRTARIWKLPELISVVELKGHKRTIWSVEFSPVDKCVITASGDKTVKIWDLADGSCLKTFDGHTSSVYKALFISRGTQFISCGGDGLVKLWTVKSNECIATYDHHEDQIWALAVGKRTEMIVSGGSEGVVNMWHDSSASDKEEAFRKEEEDVLKGQELENAIKDVDYTKAIQIAFELRRPHQLFSLFSQLCRTGNVRDHVERALHSLGKEEIRHLLEYLRDWNTKPKLCHVTQTILLQIFTIFSPTEIIQIKGVGELLEGLIPYSQRHFGRVDRLVRSSFLLDYTLTRMSVLEPNEPKHNPGSVFDDADSGATLAETEGNPKKRKSGAGRDHVGKRTRGVARVQNSAVAMQV